jgi:uncharacterized membrane protein
MSKQFVNELGELESAGVIDAETAKRIADFYAGKNKSSSDGRINLVFAILGTILVSLGIILVVAHNWDQLPRFIKISFAFLPVLIGQGLCVLALKKYPAKKVWRECSSVFLFFAVGACIAMISQVYHIPSSGGTFVFTWMLLVFPLIYLMRSAITSLLYIVGITAFATYFGGGTGISIIHYCWMLGLVIPYYLLLIKYEPRSNYCFLHHWILPLSVILSYGFVFHDNSDMQILGYTCICATFYLLGTYANFLQHKIMSNGYLVIGSIGTVIILLIAGFDDFWNLGGILGDEEINPMRDILPLIFVFSFACYLAYLFIVVKKQAINWLGLVFIPFTLIYFLFSNNPGLAAIFINILTLAAGLATIQRGNRLNHLGILNYGLIIIALLVICRFFDDQISFVIRGLMFIAVGIGFFVANNRLIKKRKLNEQ